MYYTYTIHFVDGYYYHGYHKHEGVDPLTDGYYGSPVTHREKWLTTMHWKEITGIHETIEEVTFAEQEAIRPVFATDPFCLNANCNGIIPSDLARKGAIKAGKKAGARAKELKINVCDPVNQEKGRQTQKEQGIGFYNPSFQQSEMMQENRRRNGKKVHAEKDEQGRSLHAMQLHQEKTEDGKSVIAVKAGKGAHRKKNADGKSEHAVRCGMRNVASGHLDRIRELIDPEVLKANAYKNLEKMNKSQWRCLVTGHISTYAGLSKYQNRRGIDKSLREQIG
jgi:hypothetical protein